jgi:hypothetical protein
MIKKTLRKLAILISILIGCCYGYAQTTYGNTALVKCIQDGIVIGEKTMYVDVSINETNDTLRWTAGDYYGGYFPITRVEVHATDTTYRCIPNGHREDAVFKTYDEYCKLVIRNTTDGYLKFLFAR